MTRTLRLLLGFIVASWCLLGAAVVDDPQLGPGEDWCSAIRRLRPGQELLLRGGEYAGPCTIRNGGVPGAPLVIRAADPERRPHIVYAGVTANVVEIRADHVTIRGLEFGPTLRDVDGVRIIKGKDITIEDCAFVGLGGIAVVASHDNVRGLTVHRNVIQRSQATAMYFGCHDGVACTVSGLLVERNFIEGVRAPDPEIGYGMQIKLNSSGLVRDNVIADTKGPGIMVYGSHDSAQLTVVERNVATHSHKSSGIVVGGGPVTVRNNIAVANLTAGIALEDYRGRGLLRNIVVAHNSVYRNGGGGILVPGEGLVEAIIVDNAAHASPGSSALPERRPGVHLEGNADCSAGGCFKNPEAWDFSPFPGSLLYGRSHARGEWLPRDDFFGKPRGTPPTVGALERPAGSITLELKRKRPPAP